MTTLSANLLLGALALLLLAAIGTDWRRRTIPNRLNLAVALLAVPFWWAEGLALWPDVALRLATALILFGLFVIPWAMRAMGGGDVKLIGAVALWFGFRDATLLLIVMSVAGGVLTAAMLGVHRWRRRPEPLEIPYGIAIAIGGLWLIGQRYLYHFA
jgi:prepilin peptidase CpaA